MNTAQVVEGLLESLLSNPDQSVIYDMADNCDWSLFRKEVIRQCLKCRISVKIEFKNGVLYLTFRHHLQQKLKTGYWMEKL